MKKPLTLYIPLTPDVEIELTFTRREYNGIASDPQVLLSEPAVSEFLTAIRAIGNSYLDFSQTPTLDFPAR